MTQRTQHTTSSEELSSFAAELATVSGLAKYEIEERARQLGLELQNEAENQAQTIQVEPLFHEEKRIAESLSSTHGMVRCGRLKTDYYNTLGLVPSKKFPGSYVKPPLPDGERRIYGTLPTEDSDK